MKRLALALSLIMLLPPVYGLKTQAVLDAYQSGHLERIGVSRGQAANLERVAQTAVRQELSRCRFQTTIHYGFLGPTLIHESEDLPNVKLKTYFSPLGYRGKAFSGYQLAKRSLGGYFAETTIVEDVATVIDGKPRRLPWALVQEGIATRGVDRWGERAREVLEAMERRGVRDRDEGPWYGSHPPEDSRNLGEAFDGRFVHFDADFFVPTDGVEAPQRVRDPPAFRKVIGEAQRAYLMNGVPPWPEPPALDLEEHLYRESLQKIARRLSEGDLRGALKSLTDHFKNGQGGDWVRRDSQYAGYMAQADYYHRQAAEGLEAAYRGGHERRAGEAWRKEAEEAAAAGTLLGHAWRPTPIQDYGHCTMHAFYNAISASVGFAEPLPISGFLAEARKLEVIDKGLIPEAVRRFAQALGVPSSLSDLPGTEPELRSLLGGGREALLFLRYFDGDYSRVQRHAVYLLGAFPSPSLGRWVYMVQDSNEGEIFLYDWRELKNLVGVIQVLRPAGPVRLPPGI